MLSFEQIKELIEMVAEHRLRGFEIERAGFRFKIDGQSTDPAQSAPAPLVSAPLIAAPAVAAPASAAPSSAAATAPPASSASGESAASTEKEAEPGPEEGVHELTSPIVGTFYSAPNPDAEPFVSVGSKVRRGQVLCIVEAMKLMNEIESDTDGEVVEILPQNAQPVEFGEPLFRIRQS